MIALWFLHAIAVGVLASITAAVTERLLRLWRLPVRGVWVAAIAVTLMVPAARLLSPPPADPIAPASELMGVAALAGEYVPAVVAVPSLRDLLRQRVQETGAWVAVGTARLRAVATPLNAALVTLWAAASLLLLVALARSALTLRARRRGWEQRVLDGVPVLVAPDTGPAVVGGAPARVVLPSWMLELDAPLRRMVLLHETEHIRARDPHLLLAALAAVVVAPWNPALWWQLRRLRTAVELDCDRRVLRVHHDVERYGLLLLAVGQRAGVPLRLAAPALAESTGSLERRIAVMTAPRTRRRERVLRALALGPVAALLAFGACMMPGPNHVAGPEPAAEQRAADAADAQPSQAYFEFQVERPVTQLPGGAPTYPAELRARGVSGTVIAQFVVDTLGAVEPGAFKVLESSHELFTAAVREALPGMRFTPAETRGRRVRQLVQQPFMFSLDSRLRTDSLAPTRAPRGGAAMPTRAPGGDSLAPLMRVRERTLAPTRVPDSAAATRAPLRTGELRPAMRETRPTPTRQGQAFFEFQVEKPASQLPGGAPRYPGDLRALGITGEVLARFVVDANGRLDPATFEVLRSTDERFTEAVRASLPALRYSPAEIGGRRVAQVVQQPFVFQIQDE